MKSLLLIIYVGLVFGCGGATNSTSPDPVVPETPKSSDRGNEIIAEYLKRDSAPFRKDRVRFTIKSEGDRDEIFELDVWRRQTEKGTDTMSIITKPVEDAGSGSLTIETPDQPAVIVTYAASRDEFKETDTGKMFFGGLTAQELLGEWKKYDYEFVAERDLEGKQVFEIVGKLKDGQKSVIASNRVFIDTQNYLLYELHLFDSKGKELRTFHQKDIGSANGRPYVAKTEAMNHVYISRILIDIVSREFPTSLDDSIFSREKLKQSMRK